MNNTYEVVEQNMSTLTAKLTKLNAKLARINVQPITWKEVGERYEALQDDPTKKLRYVKLEVDGMIPEQNGWHFVATLCHTDDGNIVRSVPGYDVPVEFRSKATWCDHCKCNRMRRDTYIVKHDDGRIMQVGSNCLEEFLGAPANSMTKAAEHLFNAFDICDAATKKEWLGGSNALHTFRIDLDTFLQNVAAVVLKQGFFVTRSRARQMAQDGDRSATATSDVAMNAMNHRSEGEDWANQLYPITDEAKKLAHDARQAVLAKFSPALADVDSASDAAILANVIGSFKAPNLNLSDFEHNLLSCARAEAIEPRLGGVAAYIVEAFRKSQPRPPVAQLNQNGLARIFAMFDKAKANLKKPAIRLATEEQHLHLSLAGAASKNAGFVYVKRDSGFESDYYGKISPDGRFMKVASCPATVEPLLQAFANDPEGVATKYGRLTGCCSFCARKLTDKRSTLVGYGPVCAEKFGLDWGKRVEVPADAVAA